MNREPARPMLTETWCFGPDMAIVTDRDTWVVNAKGERIARVGRVMEMGEAVKVEEGRHAAEV